MQVTKQTLVYIKLLLQKAVDELDKIIREGGDK